MTDMTATGAATGTPWRAGDPVRIARRHAAERRFRFYGIAAIAVTALFLAVLFADILSKGLPAFIEHRLNLAIMIKRDAIDPGNTRDPKTILAGDYDALIRDALRARFPEVTSRGGRKALGGLLSSGASDDVRGLVAADPDLIGTKVKAPVLLSDDADQYLKGQQTKLLRQAGTGELAVAADGDAFVLTSSAPDFREALARVGARGQAKGLDSSRPSVLIEANGGVFKATELGEAAAKAEAVTPPRTLASAPPGAWNLLELTVPEANRRIDDREATWLERLKAEGAVEKGLAWRFFTSGDSREPELAGIRGALTGTLLTLVVTLALCLPIGVAAAIHLEEFAPANRLTGLIEININNLAAVPSIVFGLLGLAVFLNFLGLPRSAPLVGGLVLALLVLPTIIIASRAALGAVPPSVKEAALGVGASHQQAVFHHVLPLAMPGIMTGTIIGMAHALGETAPLLMIGMVAFIVDVPKGIADAATVLPVQIYLWSDLPEAAFQAKTAAAIIVLLAVLFCMNAAAVLVRKRFEHRW